MTFEKWFLNQVGITFEDAKKRGVYDLSVIQSCWQAATLAERERAAKVAETHDADYWDDHAGKDIAAAISKGGEYEGVSCRVQAYPLAPMVKN